MLCWLIVIICTLDKYHFLYVTISLMITDWMTLKARYKWAFASTTPSWVLILYNASDVFKVFIQLGELHNWFPLRLLVFAYFLEWVLELEIDNFKRLVIFNSSFRREENLNVSWVLIKLGLFYEGYESFMRAEFHNYLVRIWVSKMPEY